MPDTSKLVSVAAAVVLVAGGLYAAGIASAHYRLAPYRAAVGIADAFQAVSEDATTLTGLRPDRYLARRPGTGSGVVTDVVGDDRLVLLQGLFGDRLEARLIERDGTVLAVWSLSYAEHFAPDDLDPDAADPALRPWKAPPQRDWNVSYQGIALTPEGDLLNVVSLNGLVKLDRCGARVWARPGVFHHSIEPDGAGGWWVPGGRLYRAGEPSPWPVLDTPLKVDELWHLSPDGTIERRLSALEALLEAGLEGMIAQNGVDDPSRLGNRGGGDQSDEVFHLNDVEPLPASMVAAFPMFEAGDLLVSYRNQNMIAVLDAESGRLLWWHVGSYLRQHDPDWVADGTIVLYDNRRDGTDDGSALGGSRIVAIDPADGSETVLVGGDGLFYSATRGKSQVLPDGDLLVTETNAGRAFQITRDGEIVWDYVNRYDEERVGTLFEARSYPRSFFTVETWSCGTDAS